MAAGWGGDRSVTAKKGEDTITLWVTTWDTEDDAQAITDGLALHADTRFVEPAGDDPRIIYVVKSTGQLSEQELATLVDALGKSNVEFVD
jgi:hypothetical protein